MPGRSIVLTVVAAATLAAGVKEIQVTGRSEVLNGEAMGTAGPYQQVVAKAYFAVDPKLAANRIVSDIDLAPRNQKGLVEFSADLYVLMPRDSAKGNGTVFFEVSNRGGKGMLSTFNLATSTRDPRQPEHFGDRFLLEQGYTLVWLGWQWDVPRNPELLRLDAPVAKRDGKPITGLVRAEFTPDRRVTAQSLADRDHIPYPVIDPDDRSIQLTVRDRADSPRSVVPRNRWRFPDREHVEMPSGFEPGKIYEVVYRAQDPVLAGLGPAAVRDLISFLKYGGAETPLADRRRHIKRAIGFGTSQSGRFLRTFLYYGFNQDEQGRRVFDGVWSHVAGAGRGSFNHRFAQASRDGHPHMNTFYPTDIFPFTDAAQTDPETGLTGGLLTRAKAIPKIFYSNGSYEYWGRAASLIHTSIDGRRDVEPPKDTRIYFITGSQHGPGAFPPRKQDAQYLSNPNDFRPLMRALLVALNNWIAGGKEPPASRYPRIDRGELVPLESVKFPKGLSGNDRSRRKAPLPDGRGSVEVSEPRPSGSGYFMTDPTISGVAFPVRMHRAWRADYGPEFRAKGIVAYEPPHVGKPFPMLVPQVDAGGNEIAGVRLPQVGVPLGVYTGWNLRTDAIGAPDELYSMVGSFFPFTRAQAARYKGADDYVARCLAAARQLVAEGLMLERDVAPVAESARQRWRYLMAAE
jgi:hypothetical protein